MLTRQRVLLGLVHWGQVHNDGKPVPRTHLTKHAFLLAKEYLGSEGAPFYDFVPYKYGPFSFALYRELGALCDKGYLDASCDKGPLHIGGGRADDVEGELDKLSWDVRSAIDSVTRAHINQSQDDLLREVYAKYSWYAVHSERQDLVSAPVQVPVAPMAVYTVGYEGVTIDGFFDSLLRRGIKGIIDVRYNPISRKYGFSKKTFSGIAASLNIEYVHMPELGIESSRRKGLKGDDDFTALFDWYESTLGDRMEYVKAAVRSAENGPTVLLCMEHDAESCHRRRLADAMCALSSQEVVHL